MIKATVTVLCMLGMAMVLPVSSAKDLELESCLLQSSESIHTARCLDESVARQNSRIAILNRKVEAQGRNIAKELQDEMRTRNVKQVCGLDTKGTSNDYKGYTCLIHHSYDVVEALEKRYASSNPQ